MYIIIYLYLFLFYLLICQINYIMNIYIKQINIYLVKFFIHKDNLYISL